MGTLTVTAGAVDMTTDYFALTFLQDSLTEPYGTSNATQFQVRNTFFGGNWQFRGTSFSNPVDGIPLAGTLTSFTLTTSGVLASSTGSFTLTQLSAQMPDLIVYLALQDSAGLTRYLFAGNDSMNGGAMDDTFVTGLGTDTINGNGGTDRVVWDTTLDAAPVSFSISLANMASATGTAFGNASTVRNVERFEINTGAGDDTLTLSDFPTTGFPTHRFWAGAGNDRLVADFSTSAGQFNLSVNFENIFFQNSNFQLFMRDVEAVTLTANGEGGSFQGLIGDDIFTGGAGGDAFFGNGGADQATGGGGNDELFGGDGDDTLDGGDGNDRVGGGLGIDAVSGGDGNDEIYGDTGDTMLGGDGDDTIVATSGAVIDGGAGNDSLNANAANNFTATPAPVTLILNFTGAPIDGALTVQNIERYQLSSFSSGSFDDVYTVIGPLNSQGEVYGWAGTDRFVADLSAEGARVFLQDVSGTHRLQGVSGRIEFNSIEQFDIIATAFNDTMTGLSGDDILAGAAGADAVYGGFGNDTLISGQGFDTMNGEGDFGDVASFASDPGAVFVQMSWTWARDGWNDEDQIVNVEHLIGSAFSDVLITDWGANAVNGGAGNDWIEDIGDGGDGFYGQAGNDIVWGGVGDDLLSGDANDDALLGGLGNDALYGETGIDWIYAGQGADYVSGGDGDDVLFGAEGGGAGANDDLGDQIFGGAGIDALIGEGGNDTLDGGADDDWVYGGVGDDTIGGGGGNDRLAGEDGNDTILGGSGDDFVYGAYGDDQLDGGAGNDWIEGSFGADVIIGGLGADSLFGGGFDRFVYNSTAESTEAAADVIGLFYRPEGDKIDVTAIDADGNEANGDTAFSFVSAFSNVAAQAVISFDGTNSVLRFDVNGDGASDLSIVVLGMEMFASDVLA